MKVLVLAGYGINCEEETKFAFELAGGQADIVHINDLIDRSSMLDNYQVLAFPGGFSFGDDTGSGKAYANRIKNHLVDAINKFISRDTLIIGICNGFQILTELGLLEGALTHNDSSQFINRWVDLEINSGSPWLKGINKISLPVAHGEGKYYTCDQNLAKLINKKQIALKYALGDICEFADYQANPNGSIDNIAGILSENGRILGMMPHPERAIFFNQQPDWTYLKESYKRESKSIPERGSGLKFFENAFEYFL